MRKPIRWFGRAAASLVLDLARMRARTPYMGLAAGGLRAGVAEGLT